MKLAMRILSLLMLVERAVSITLEAIGDSSDNFGLLNASGPNCRDRFYRANGTGTVSLNSRIIANLAHVEKNYTWTMTVGHPNSTSNGSESYATDLWLGMPAPLDVDNGDNPFSACAYSFNKLPLNTIKRGQSDEGYCLQTLDESCINAIQSRAADVARWLTWSDTPGPFSNLTPPILDYICQDIFNSLGSFGSSKNPFPDECAPYLYDPFSPPPQNLGEVPHVTMAELTSNYTHNQTCRFSDSGANMTYETPFDGYRLQSAGSLDPTALSAIYDNATQTVIPILTVLFNKANNSRKAAFDYADASFSCLRIRDFADGSRIPPPLGPPNPVYSRGGLGTGAIAGIVVGCVIAVALLAFAAWFAYRRKRRRATAATAAAAAAAAAKAKATDTGDGSSDRLEMAAGQLYQLDRDKPLPEMSAAGMTPQQLESKEIKQEHDKRDVANAGHVSELPAVDSPAAHEVEGYRQ